MGRLTGYIDNKLVLKETGIMACGSICKQTAQSQQTCEECPLGQVIRKLARYEDMAEQGYVMFDIDRAVADMEKLIKTDRSCDTALGRSIIKLFKGVLKGLEGEQNG